MAGEEILGIVTDVVRHSDRYNVVTLYTRSRGRISLLSPAGSSKSARMRNARLMPLSVVQAQVNFRQNRDLQIMGSISTPHVWRELYYNPLKSSIAIFLAEFLNAFLRHSSVDEQQWDYIYNSLMVLDASEGSVGNFHIAMLIGFLHFAGIYPDLSEYHEGVCFDMRAGELTDMYPGHRDVIVGEDVARIVTLSRMTMRNYSHYKMSGEQRSRILNGLLHYYSLHFPGMANLKSPAVLAELFR